jgi:hypothetical protein
MTPNDLRTLLQRPIAFHRVFVDVTGSVTAALMLSQALYWSDKGDDGWFWKKQPDWERETGLTRRELDSARTRLKQLGILSEELKGAPPKIHFRLEMEVLYKLIWRKAPNQSGGNVPSNLAESAKSYKEAESTSESTSETTKDSPPSSEGGNSKKEKKLTQAQELYEVLKAGWNKSKLPPLIWEKQEWANMNRLLRLRPDLTPEVFKKMLRNRFKSEEVNRAQRPMYWLCKLPEYELGPLDRFGKPLQKTENYVELTDPTDTPEIRAREREQDRLFELKHPELFKDKAVQ